MSELRCIETGCLLNEPVELDGVGRAQEVLLARAGVYEMGDPEGSVLQRLDERFFDGVVLEFASCYRDIPVYAADTELGWDASSRFSDELGWIRHLEKRGNSLWAKVDWFALGFQATLGLCPVFEFAGKNHLIEVRAYRLDCF